MRWVMIAAWLVGGALLCAAQANAHESHAASPAQTEPAPAEAVVVEAFAPAMDGICEAAPTIVVAATAEDSAHGHGHAHAHAHRDADHEHDPTDHRHPPGEDVFHQMAAHGCPDFAAYHDATPRRAASSVAHPFPLRHDVAEGIALVPPVPPPLG